MSGKVAAIWPRLSSSARKRHVAFIDAEAAGRQRELVALMQGATTRVVRYAAREWKRSHAPLHAARLLERLACVLRAIDALGEQRRSLCDRSDLG